MKIIEVRPSDPCPCGCEQSLARCPLAGRPRPYEIFPDNKEGSEGCLIRFFAVFREDGTTAIVIPQKTFRLYVHPELDMELLDRWLCGQFEKDTVPSEIQMHLDRVKELTNKNYDSPVIYSNLKNGYKFTGNREALQHILGQVWHARC